MINFYKKKFLPLLTFLLMVAPLLVKGRDMDYSSSTVTQNTNRVKPGAINQQVIGIRIVTDGEDKPLSVTSFTISTSGTTNIADITNARLYYTRTNGTFATTNQFGSVIISPNGTVRLNGSQILADGTNYFWLTYDIPNNATIGNLVDASCTSLIVDGNVRTPSTTAPVGARKIELPLSGTYTIDQKGSGVRNFTTFNAAIAALNANGLNGGVIFQVASGQTFNEAPLTITETGSSANPITFIKSGSFANPVLQGTSGTGSSDKIMTINAGDYITFNGIDFKDNPNNVGSAKMEYGVFFTNTATNGSTYNSIQNSNITLDKTNSNLTYGVFANNTTATSSSGTNSYNTFYNNNIQNVSYGYYFKGHNTYSDNGNEIGGNNLGNTISNFGMAAIYLVQQTGGKVTSNVITNGVGSTIMGVHVIGASSTVDIIRNNLSAISTSSSSGKVFGIYIESATSTNVANNSLTNLAGTDASSNSTNVQAIEVDGGASNIYNNLITNISNASFGSGSIVNGILTKGGSTFNIYNNMVSDLRADKAVANPSVRAISLEGGTTINLFFNSLHLSSVSTTSSHSSATLYITDGPGTVNIRNNILYNRYNVATGTRAVAFFKSTTSYANIASTSNNNLIFAGTPSAKKLLFYDGSNSAQTLSSYKNRLGPTRETAAISVDPYFVSAKDLHLNTCYTPNKVPAIGSVTLDIDGDSRTSNPVIGADEMEVGSNIIRWIGAVSTDWHNSSNWSCSQVPVSSSVVIIAASATNQPVITSGTAVAKNITIDNGASLTINGGSLTVSEVFNLNGTLTNNEAGTLILGGALTLNTQGNNLAAVVNNSGAIQVSSSVVVNEGNITNNGSFQIGTDLTVAKGSGNNYITTYGTLEVARHFSSEADVNIENAGDLVVEGDLTTSATFLNNGMDGIGNLVVNGRFTNSIDGHFTNFFGVATVTDFYNNSLIDGDLGSFAIAGISENAQGAVIRGGIDICDSSLEAGKNFVDNNYGLIEWGTFDTNPDDGNVTQCGEEAIFKPLPVTLINWQGLFQNNQVILKWQTASEQNSGFFTIERSFDGKAFQTIGTIPAAGNSTQLLAYKFTDINAPAGIVYYRLKQIDLDGTFTYSAIIPITTKAITFNVTAFPNPISGSGILTLHLQGTANQQYFLEVIDSFGQIISKETIEMKNAHYELTIPASVTGQLKSLGIIRCSNLTTGSVQATKVLVR